MQVEQAEQVKDSLLALQESLQIKLLNADSKIQCKQDQWKRSEGGGGKTLAFSKGEFIEKGGINFSDVSGGKLPKTATQNRPELEGASFRGMGVSVADVCAVVSDGGDCLELFPAHPASAYGCEWLAANF